MSVRFEHLDPGHLADFEVQPAQAYLERHLTDVLVTKLRRAGVAFAAVEPASGRTLAMAGLLNDRRPALGWAILGTHVGVAGVGLWAVHQPVARFLAGYGLSVQTGIVDGDKAGERWAMLLGFRPAGPVVDLAFDVDRPVRRWVRRADPAVVRRTARELGAEALHGA